MAGTILENLKQRVSGLELVPSTGGCFEIQADEDLIYSKLKTGEFPSEAAILDALQGR